MKLDNLRRHEECTLILYNVAEFTTLVQRGFGAEGVVSDFEFGITGIFCYI
jgi:hypothetical protein